ncbi:hypothetical protein MLD38_015041 [Melastoma candidum]|uniref:Uncharacterized protein n=1 Tax=Melastoma candidum TaxID=119954 RepID=A0ACB9REQ1_9MYRT|nr:hypothetical protein MLD38_015041 [Melastoma candidum]
MDPCPYVRLVVESLSLKLPSSPVAVSASVPAHLCELRVNVSPVPFVETTAVPVTSLSTSLAAASFDLDPDTLVRLTGKPVSLDVSIYVRPVRRGCRDRKGKLLGGTSISLNFEGSKLKPVLFHKGWVSVRNVVGTQGESIMIHLVVRSEPDPRFIFQFGGKPELSPVVFQVQWGINQPVFSCQFSMEKNCRQSRTLLSETRSRGREWRRALPDERPRLGRERRGWMVMIYDLSGSPAAVASIITPFVPSPRSDRVTQSNPGVWLILRPAGPLVSNWKPWGRLEAWRERRRGSIDKLGYKFKLVTEDWRTDGIPIAETAINVMKGGLFRIDRGTMNKDPQSLIKGFVMGSTVHGEGKNGSPEVQIGARHMACAADAALFIALSAAINLSMAACRVFSE